MAKAEYETIILLNDQDIYEGFFDIGTSKINHYQSILKRVGGAENLIELDVSADETGKPCYWSMKIPVEYLSQTFCIKSLSRMKLGSSHGFQKEKVVGQGIP